LFINKIKQNLAGFAAVAIAFAGFSAMAPATASTAALADPTNMAFSGVKQLTVSGGSATGSITQTNAGRGLLAATFTVDQATANTLSGANINGSLTLTGPNGAINLGSEGFFSQNLIYALANTEVGQGPIGSAQDMVWPAGTNHASTNVLISAYINRDSFSFASGSYTLSATFTKNGVAQTLGSGIALASASIEYRVAGRTLNAVDATYNWNSGYVCVDMAQVVAGDVLTVEQVQNATASTGGSIDWYRGGSTMGSAYGNNRAVTSADITAGNLAMRLSASVGTPGQALSMDVNIKKANGTDVSVSCAPSAGPSAAPTAVATGSSITVTYTANGYTNFACALFDSNNALVSSTYTTSTSLTTCNPYTSTSGTYTAKYAYANYGIPSAWSPASSSFTVTVGGGQGNPSPTCPSAMTSIHSTQANLNTSNSYSLYLNNDTTQTGCVTSPIAGGGVRTTLNGTVVGTPFFSVQVGFLISSTPRTLATLLANPALSSLTITDGAVYTVSYYRNLTAAPTASDVPFASYSLTLYPNGGSAPQVQNNVAPSVPTNIPVVAPIKVPVLGVAPGASLVLAGENMKSLTSVKIGANAATTKTTVAGLEIVVPADLKPGAHDLLIATSTGSTLFVGAIKVADPVIVAAKAAQAKAAASIAYRAPVDLTVAKSVTGSQAAQVKALASQYKNAKTAICEAIPASKATVASARAAAVKVCATIKAALPKIKTEVVVSAPSGEKANRVSSEIQG
jgi:hypothetical protein